MEGINKFLELLRQTKVKKTNEVYHDEEKDAYCAIGAVCHELGVTPSWYRLIDAMPPLPINFFEVVTKINDIKCKRKRSFKCVADSIEKFYKE